MAQGWESIDRLILAGEAGEALALIRQRGAPMDIGTAIALFDERYEYLRDTRPDDFVMGVDDGGRDASG
mgnify:FL=1